MQVQWISCTTLPLWPMRLTLAWPEWREVQSQVRDLVPFNSNWACGSCRSTETPRSGSSRGPYLSGAHCDRPCTERRAFLQPRDAAGSLWREAPDSDAELLFLFLFVVVVTAVLLVGGSVGGTAGSGSQSPFLCPTHRPGQHRKQV